MKQICLDSSGWIEVTHEGQNAPTFLKVLATPSSLIVPVITLYEVRKYSLLHANETKALQITQFMEQGQVVPVDVKIAELGANLSIKHKLAMADALIYATALSHNAILWTQDIDFKNLPHVKCFPKTKP